MRIQSGYRLARPGRRHGVAACTNRSLVGRWHAVQSGSKPLLDAAAMPCASMGAITDPQVVAYGDIGIGSRPRAVILYPCVLADRAPSPSLTRAHAWSDQGLDQRSTWIPRPHDFAVKRACCESGFCETLVSRGAQSESDAGRNTVRRCSSSE